MVMCHYLKNCTQFIAMDENKTDIANFPSNELMSRAQEVPSRCELVVVAGSTPLIGLHQPPEDH